jgi:hypothetical protein
VWELVDGRPAVTPFAPLPATVRRALPEGAVIV